MQDLIAILIVASPPRFSPAAVGNDLRATASGALRCVLELPSARSLRTRNVTGHNFANTCLTQRRRGREEVRADRTVGMPSAPLRLCVIYSSMPTATDRNSKHATRRVALLIRAKAIAPSPAAGLVRQARPRLALAAVARSVPRVGQRDHAAADAGGDGPRLLRAVCRDVSQRPPASRPPMKRRAATVGRPRLLPPRTATARGRKASRRRARRPVSASSRASSQRCPASAATRPARSPRSRSTSGRRFSKPTRFAC